MERRLLKAIMLPSIVAVFSSGLLMIYLNYYLMFELYFQIKVILVILMGYIHGKYSRMYKELENDKRNKAHTYYRIWNEVPACIMVFIVLLIVIKPF
jgi:putative membrane protein